MAGPLWLAGMLAFGPVAAAAVPGAVTPASSTSSMSRTAIDVGERLLCQFDTDPPAAWITGTRADQSQGFSPVSATRSMRPAASMA